MKKFCILFMLFAAFGMTEQISFDDILPFLAEVPLKRNPFSVADMVVTGVKFSKRVDVKCFGKCSLFSACEKTCVTWCASCFKLRSGCESCDVVRDIQHGFLGNPPSFEDFHSGYEFISENNEH